MSAPITLNTATVSQVSAVEASSREGDPTSLGVSSVVTINSVPTKKTECCVVQIICIIWKKICECFSCLWEKIKKCCGKDKKRSDPKTNLLPITMAATGIAFSCPQTCTGSYQQKYWALSQEKWKEGIDGRYEHLGPLVFDKALHNGTKEEGFVQSLINSYAFIHEHLGERVTAKFYLDLHRILCSHFRGEDNGVLMGPEKIGVFRDSDDNICFPVCGAYNMSPEAFDEYWELDELLVKKFGKGICYFTYEDERVKDKTKYITKGQLPRPGMTVNYYAIPRAKVEEIFTFFLDEYYKEIDEADKLSLEKLKRDKKLTAVARLFQRLDWLHPPRDGSTRSEWQLINKLLTDAGFHPMMNDYPMRYGTWTVAAGKRAIEEGLAQWEEAVEKLNAKK